MHCRLVAPGIIVCGSRRKLKDCSTPGCRNKAELACDHPIIRARSLEPKPKRGDCRLHREHKLLFFVWSVNPDGTLTVSQSDPGNEFRPAVLQDVTEDRWFEVSDPTCDRPVCRRCAVQSGGLDYCGAHGRALPAEAT